MSESSIFVSYRREDSPGEAGRLYDRLAARYGSREVFRDIDHSQPGTPFPARLVNVIGSSQVVLVAIGPRWLTALNQRLQQPEDYVRLEVQAAISHDVRLIPVLVQGATMPRQEEHPAGRCRLRRRHQQAAYSRASLRRLSAGASLWRRSGRTSAATTPIV
ncbi:MAG: toll/interleukin-1 receptor domain-containing protein [Candidatus Dormibacteraeota bacterium]|nr:toll/interleukin-1 receptor domain-containing protein [Candidatus Dormibacteraeota bacterium]